MAYATSTQHCHWFFRTAHALALHRHKAREYVLLHLKEAIIGDIALRLSVDITENAEYAARMMENTELIRMLHFDQQTATINVISEQKQQQQQQQQCSHDDQNDNNEDVQKMANEIRRTCTEKPLIGCTTEEEEENFIHYFAQSIPMLGAKLKVPRSVIATAFSLYNRFYVKRSIMHYHPKHIMLTCFYVAGKAEDHWIKVERLSDNAGHMPAEAITGLELTLLEAVDFHLRIWHPFRPLRGWITFLHEKGVTLDAAIVHRTEELLQSSQFTDAEFIYTPSHIALAALYLESDRSTLIQPCLDKMQNSYNGDLLEHLREIASLLEKGAMIRQRPRKAWADQCKPLDRKLKPLHELLTKRNDILKLVETKRMRAAKLAKAEKIRAQHEAQIATTLGDVVTSNSLDAAADEDFVIRSRSLTNRPCDDSELPP